MAKFYATTDPEVTVLEAKHYEMSRKIASAGMVLLENNGVLPLKAGRKIALYGSGARHTIHGGLGAAGVQARHVVTIEEGLKEAGFEVTTKHYLDRFDAIEQAASDTYYGKLKAINPPIMAVVTMYANPYIMPDMEILDEDLPEDRGAAIYVISRNAGEGADRKPGKGDYELSDAEVQNLKTLSSNFEDVIVVLNVGGVIDTKFAHEISNVSALIVMNQPGNLAGHALADVLSAKVNPEGKLASTWAKNLADYVSSVDFLIEQKKVDDTEYEDGIYVGYRYFDSFRVEPAYPFGFGLSYSQFSIDAANAKVEVEDQTIQFSVEVRNIGTYAGRETVQLYVSSPRGALSKAYQDLKGYTKTKVIAPGESEVVEVKVDASSLASYSQEKAAWILEAGKYVFRLGNQSRNTHVAAVWNLDKEIVTQQCKRLFKEGDCVNEMTAPEFDTEFYPGEWTEIEAANNIVIDTGKIPYVKYSYDVDKPVYKKVSDEIILFEDVVSGKHTMGEFIGQLSIDEMARICVGSDAEHSFMDDPTREDTAFVLESTPGASTGTSSRFEEKYGIPKVTTADGGAGLRVAPVFEVAPDGRVLTDGVASIVGMEKVLEFTGREDTTKYYQYTTSLPIPTMIAQTWDTDLMYDAGRIVSEEMQVLHLGYWLAPSMNIHRNPLCGRNFEYYSEDPYVTGISSTYMTKGVQSIPGYSVTIKHMACNNQEDNRNSLSANVTERTIREIYLKGYEIAIRKADPHAIMTSYNLINGTHAANLYEMLTEAVRCEFGFSGVVMTDFGTTGKRRPGSSGVEPKYGPSSAPGCIQAGNDLVMPGSPDDIADIAAAAKDGSLALCDLQWCTKNVLTSIQNSHWFTDPRD